MPLHLTCEWEIETYLVSVAEDPTPQFWRLQWLHTPVSHNKRQEEGEHYQP